MRHDQSRNQHTTRWPGYHSVPLRTHAAQRNTTVPKQEQRPTHAAKKSYISRDQLPIRQDDEQFYQPARIPNSAIRYRTTEGHEAIRLGNQEIVVHHEPARRRFSWMFFCGLGMIAALVLFLIVQWSVAAWNAHSLDGQYGYPRTWQTDQVVGHDDSQSHPSHFIFENLNGQVIFIEIPGDDITKSRIYSITTLFGQDAASIPVTASFEDVNGDGKIDIIVEIGNAETSIFLNTGSGFAPEK